MTPQGPLGKARRRGVVLGVPALLSKPWRGAWASAAALRVGLVPYLSTRAMLSVYGPLRRHLETQLGRPVEFYTAASFSALAENARAGGQPFTMMPMHLARLATSDWGFTLVARSAQESAVNIWAPRRLGLEGGGAAAVRGRRVAVIDPLSITAMMFQRWRQAERLEGTVQVDTYPGINSALIAISRGESDLIAAASGQLRDVPGYEAIDLRPVVPLGSILTPAFVAAPGTAIGDVAAFRAALLSFRPQQPGGASAALWVEAGPGDLEPYERYAAEARRLLAEGRPGR